MNLLDKLLEEKGISYEQLNPAEKETYNSKNFDIPTLTLGDLKENVFYMLISIAEQLSSQLVVTDEDKAKDSMLKARLKNYILLHSFLTAPEKAEKALRKQLENLKK